MSRLSWIGVVALSLAGGLAIVRALPAPPIPPSLQLTGHSGYLAEWSLAATLASDAAGGGFNGALIMEHTGWCSLNGPEKKTGEMRVRLARFGSTMNAKVLIDGIECAYDGTLSDVYTGMLLCPGTRPVPLTVWIK